jgi:outer membrane protein assembly factor BamB
MNYNPILDGFYSTPWIYYGLLFVYLAIVISFKKRLFPHPERWIGQAIFIYAIPILWLLTNSMFNPAFLGYGRPDAIAKVTAVDGKLYVIDYLLTGGGKSHTPIHCYRMHIIDATTGEKKRRFMLESGLGGGINFVHGDTIAYTNPGKVTFYSCTSGGVLNTWSEKTLPKLFPQLASGVKNVEYRPAKNVMELSSLDGNKWSLNIRDNSIAPYNEQWNDDYKPTGRIYIDDGKIVIDNQRFGSTLVTFCTVKGTDHKSVLCHRDSVLNGHITFLYGTIVALSVKDSCFVVRDYDNLNRIGADFTCMSLDGKRKLWELRESAVRPNDPKDQPVKESSCIDTQDGIFFASIANEVFAIRMNDGKILWRQVP